MVFGVNQNSQIIFKGFWVDIIPCKFKRLKNWFLEKTLLINKFDSRKLAIVGT